MLTINNTLDGYLKDVEIKGNTVQDPDNLADIRSVGDKVEGQELYEIPVLSRGKNLFNGKWERGYALNLESSSPLYGKPQAGENYSTTQDFIKVNPNETYYFTDTTAQRWVVFYDKDKKPISHDQRWSTCVTPNNTAYVKFYDLNTRVDAFPNYSVSRIDNVYEPYQEDKLTILSPTLLEKVGDVADRIIEKDGVWGVEKNVVGMLLNETNCTISMRNSSEVHPNYVLFDFSVTDTKSYIKTGALLCDKINYLPYSADRDACDKEGCWLGNAIFFTVKILKSRLESTDVDGMKKWLKTNNLNLKYPTTQPQFIPLPHDQQVKLRTFAGKTNISFLTEIEGTIKAQVPKSLGATVNTHTEQISNLNKELDRVKKLEESTVSTVTTESGFTTVEATKNGYFEDVKLEGKTFVNLSCRAYSVFRFAGAVKTDTHIVSIESLSNDSYVGIQFNNTIEMGKTYTLVMDVDDISGAKYAFTPSILYPIGSDSFTKISPDFKGLYVSKITANKDIAFNEINPASNNRGFRIGVNCKQGGTFKIKTIVILEGDHTQNPPSGCIEGLKSVGQDVEEVSVESVNENLWNDVLLSEGVDRAVNKNPIKFHSGYTYTLSFRGLSTLLGSSNIQIFLMEHRGYPYPIDGNSEGVVQVISNWSNKDSYTFTVPRSGKFYIQTRGSQEAMKSFTDISLSVGETGIHTPHQSDKKRLLYYNEETQAWEKPILREWDSIEKHANGKYYYHQRSGEVVLNGSEGWSTNDGFSTGEYIACITHVALPGKKYGVLNMVSDKFKTKNCALLPVVEEGIWGEVGNSVVYISVSKSKLSSQDAQGFKQWLQANNVTVVYQLAEEKVYECTNIDLITYANETNFIVESGVLSPKTTLKVHNNISNVVSLLQKKVSLLENNVTSYMTTQNRLMLASRYNSDTVSFKVDYVVCSENMSQENYDTDLYNLILNNILVGKDNYDYDHMFNIIMDYASWSQISWDQFDILVGLMDIQHNPPIEEIPTDDEIVEEIPNEIM